MTSASGLQPVTTPDWNNLQVLHRNTLEPRAHFHVYRSEDDALSNEPEQSTTHSLSGTWKFQYSKSPFEAPEGFHAKDFDTSKWDDVSVPGMWQLQGYGRPQYTNVNFPIPVDPPNVPFTENETGSYVSKFRIPSAMKDDQIRLRFEGVDSAYHVWVNGEEIGYSQGSRNPDEFDITDNVSMDVENTLAVRVYQYCDGTYIEDQDQWRMSGIFRDVTLVGFPKAARIENVYIQTVLDDKYVDADLKVRVTVKGSGKVRLKLLDAEKHVIGSASKDCSESEQINLTIPVQNPSKWTAESPYLYTIVLSLDSIQHIHQRVGFRKVEMKDGLIKVNGRRIVFRGVNRHEHHPRTGRTVPLDFLKQDLLTMKRHNVNAIRTSHQPNDTRLCDLADEMGFWVIDEADLECHGFESIEDSSLSPEQRSLPFRERQLITRGNAAKWTTDNPAWKHAYVDRAEQLVKRDQTHPSVIIWSLGNEAFMGQNFVAMYEHIKAYDDSRPIHYEADIHAQTMDMYSLMYPPVEEIIKFGEDESKQKPLILCEYIHAMGNGPGNIKEYIDAFYKYPKLQGGFAWEWANHGLVHKDAVTGEEYHAYGGDFGDEPNDSTFVMDGLVDSDHTPNPGLIEYKKAIEPVQVVEIANGKVRFINRYDFITLDHLECYTCIVSDPSSATKSEKVAIPANVEAGQTFEMKLPTTPGDVREAFLNVTFQTKNATDYLEAGFEVANAQISLTKDVPLQILSSAVEESLTVKSCAQNVIEIRSKNSTWKFNTLHGTLTSWLKGNTELISQAPEVSFFRAPTDNDIPQDGWNWEDKYLHMAKVSTRKVEWSQAENSDLIITVQQRVAPPVLSWSIDCTLLYHLHSNGSLNIGVQGTPQGVNLPRTLPRVGLVFEMPKPFKTVEWYGRGPGESYRDSKLSQLVSHHKVSNIDDLWTEYEVPQESSNRTDTRWLKVSATDSAEESLFMQFAGADGKISRLFDFQASHYRMEDVAEAKHPYELRRKKKSETVLRLDWQHHGLGSGSCGPRTRDEYALLCESFEFNILLQ